MFLPLSRAFLQFHKEDGETLFMYKVALSIFRVTNHISFIRPTDDRISSNL